MLANGLAVGPGSHLESLNLVTTRWLCAAFQDYLSPQNGGGGAIWRMLRQLGTGKC